jgi:hypothetical protein
MAYHLHFEIPSQANVTCAVINVDTTASNDITVTAQWNAAKTGNILRLEQGFIEYKN